MIPAPVNPPMTISVQNNLANFGDVGMYDKPWIVEVSKNVLNPSILTEQESFDGVNGVN